MTPERWARVKAVVALALERDDGTHASVIAEACAGDASLRAEVEALLQSRRDMGSFLEPPADDERPDLRAWTHYELVHALGRGGMATVYKAWDPRLHRFVAVKVISEQDATTVSRFLREAEAQARVDHDHVLKIFETGSVGAHRYIAMQFVDGPTLLGVRDDTTLDEKIELMAKVAEGLHAAHRRGLVHRDIKPGNILVERGDDGLKPYLLDFGLAADTASPAMTQTGVIVGTPRYMAPERLQGRDASVDRRSDIYSFGATLYEFVGGVAPFAESSGLQLLIDVAERDIRPLREVIPSVPPEIEAIVGMCLEKDPAHRYASARALADDLRRYLDGEPVQARPSGLLRRVARKAQRHPRIAVSFAALATAIVLVAGWGAYQYQRSTRQADLAEQFGQEIQNVDWMFRAAQMSPQHDITPQKTQVRDSMSRIESMMRDVGSIAFGPGQYALGRGWLTLGDDHQAIEHLELAWNSGYRAADVAMSLGLAYNNRYQSELAVAERIESKDRREARIAELQRSLRDRALSLLAQGRASAIVPAHYVEALMDRLAGRADQAAAKAEETLRDTPWLFEARLMLADAAFKRAGRTYELRDLNAAMEQASDAKHRYEDAARVAPSAVDAAIGQCGATAVVVRAMLEAPDPPPDGGAQAYRDIDAVCPPAMAIDPESAEAHRVYAEALANWASVRVRMHDEAEAAFDRATTLAERAVALSGNDLATRVTLGDVVLDRSWGAFLHNRDARPQLDRAIAIYQDVLRIDPRSANMDNMLAQAFILRSRFDIRDGIDPAPAKTQAIDYYKQAIRLDAASPFNYSGIVQTALSRAGEQTKRGADPLPGIRDVLAFLESVSGTPDPPARREAIDALRARVVSVPAASASARPDGR
jgi:serine/threonine-protein kinase